MARTPKNSIETAKELIQQDYYADVRELARQLINQNPDKDRRFAALDELVKTNKRLETVSGCREILAISDNADAYREEFGVLPPMSDPKFWRRLAYAALMCDIQECANAIVTVDLATTGDIRSQDIEKQEV